jgi:hypothetical protein
MSYNSYDPTQRAALTAELNSDPRSYGYAADITAGNDVALVEKLNLPRTAANGGAFGAITVRRGIRTGIDVMNCIDIAAYDPLSVGKQQYLIALVTPVEGVDLSNDVVRANLLAIFPSGAPNTATRARLQAAADKIPASRFEELFGIESRATNNDVAQALGRG